MTRSNRTAVGFTLIELMVVLAVLAILSTLSAPSFTSFMRSAELSTAADSFIASLNAARSEAMKRNLPALVMPLESGRQDWSQGFIVFVDVDRDGTYTESVDVVVMRRPITGTFLKVAGNGTAKAMPSYVRYDGSGFAKRSDGSFGALSLSFSRNDVSPEEVFAQTRRIFIARTGRVRICTPTSARDARCELLDTDP
ncbi:GspH/FimT family pseudopilin [Variovorax sp. RHLX14]|uniref:GspH/FimT family pseudopilin n=1 Tax=Variovorax sp. RHLX14 TaxID=1259731 RepID=UPI003F47972E